MSTEIPEGFEPFVDVGGYISHNGPYYASLTDDGTYRYGFKADERHGNPNNVLHGAAIMGFADTVLGHLVVYTTHRFCATISLTTEFISGAPLGGWIEATAQIKRTTNNLAFASTDVHFEDKLLLSATGVFKLFKAQ